MTESIVREASLEVLDRGDRRELVVRLARWLDPRTVRGDQHPDYPDEYREQFAIDAVVPDEVIELRDRHGGTTIGTADPATLENTPDGPVIRATVTASALGDHHLARARDGEVSAVSMEFVPDPATDIRQGDLITRTRALLRGIALSARPVHDAPILAVREESTIPTNTTEDPMSDDTMTLPDDVVRRPELDTLARSEQLDELHRDMLERLEANAPAPNVSPLARFDTFGEYAHELVRSNDSDLKTAFRDAVTLELHRATQDSAGNTGLVQPQWLTEVVGLWARTRPTATAFGITPKAPGEGNTYAWPTAAGIDVATLVGTQAAEGDAVTSVVTDITTGTATSETWAGGSSISWQLVRNSSPSFLDTYRRLMSIGYAVHSEVRTNALMLAGATASGESWSLGSGTTEELVQALVAAAIDVEINTGSPGSFALASTNVYKAAAGKDGFIMGAFGSNSGNAATRADINIPRLIHDQYLPDDTLVVSNMDAGTVFEDGPMVATADDPLTLTGDWAIWGQGTFGVFLSAGIRTVSIGA